MLLPDVSVQTVAVSLYLFHLTTEPYSEQRIHMYNDMTTVTSMMMMKMVMMMLLMF